MAENVGPIDYQRLARAIGRANKAEKIIVDLNIVHIGFPIPASLLASGGQRITILDVGAGTFDLTLIFQDGTTITLDETEISTGDILDWDFYALYIANGAQPGLTLTLIVDYRLIVGVGGY